MATPNIHLTVTNSRDKTMKVSNYDIDMSLYVSWFIVKPCGSVTTDDADALLKYEDEYAIVGTGDSAYILVDIMKSTTDITPDTYKYEWNLENISTGDVIKIISGNYVAETDLQKVF